MPGCPYVLTTMCVLSDTGHALLMENHIFSNTQFFRSDHCSPIHTMYPPDQTLFLPDHTLRLPGQIMPLHKLTIPPGFELEFLIWTKRQVYPSYNLYYVNRPDQVPPKKTNGAAFWLAVCLKNLMYFELIMTYPCLCCRPG